MGKKNKNGVDLGVALEDLKLIRSDLVHGGELQLMKGSKVKKNVLGFSYSGFNKWRVSTGTIWFPIRPC